MTNHFIMFNSQANDLLKIGPNTIMLLLQCLAVFINDIRQSHVQRNHLTGYRVTTTALFIIHRSDRTAGTWSKLKERSAPIASGNFHCACIGSSEDTHMHLDCGSDRVWSSC